MYVSGIRDMTGVDHSFIHFQLDNGFGVNMTSFAFDDSDKYSFYSYEELREFYNSGCKGIVHIPSKKLNSLGDYFAYKTTKYNLALMSCLEYQGIDKELPSELFSLSYILPVKWSIPVFLCCNGNECYFKDVNILTKCEAFGFSDLSSLIFRYFSTASKLGSAVGYNMGLLSKLILDETVSKCYVDYTIKTGCVYRLHSSQDVFQYLGCPLYIDSDDNLYLGFYNLSIDQVLTGVVQYKITDRKRFNSLVSKVVFLYGKKYDNMILDWQ